MTPRVIIGRKKAHSLSAIDILSLFPTSAHPQPSHAPPPYRNLCRPHHAPPGVHPGLLPPRPARFGRPAALALPRKSRAAVALPVLAEAGSAVALLGNYVRVDIRHQFNVERGRAGHRESQGCVR
ncbi:hypothetical protein BC936DRAFT_139724 [Jimgerdemannia flammicorona]|uniref:Uncharacterized protein n=1 Tax=Jimgerdemannia flammicorona TaxID=994334 RepID=A0A433B9C0_9FUNG|nr:hypothetical protein BC936DRAFT_139724 [Jimgerdemannia flammicorona]